MVIINLGTNDAVRSVQVTEAGKRMESVVDEIWKADGMGNTCVFLSTLIPTTDEAGKPNRMLINAQFRDLVKRRSRDNCIYLADMAPNGEEWFVISEDFLDTEQVHVHPNVSGTKFQPSWIQTSLTSVQDQGHKKMAAVFLQAINRAASDGKMSAADMVDIAEPYCDKFEGTGTDAGGKTQRSSGFADRAYSHDSTEMGVSKLSVFRFDKNERQQVNKTLVVLTWLHAS